MTEVDLGLDDPLNTAPGPGPLRASMVGQVIAAGIRDGRPEVAAFYRVVKAHKHVFFMGVPTRPPQPPPIPASLSTQEGPTPT